MTLERFIKQLIIDEDWDSNPKEPLYHSNIQSKKDLFKLTEDNLRRLEKKHKVILQK